MSPASPHPPADPSLHRYCPYVILGYGIAGQAALRALLEREPTAHVLVVDARPDGPVPPPSTQLPKTAKVEFARGVRATSLDPDRGVLTLAENITMGSRTGPASVPPPPPARPKLEKIAFGRCLLALGSTPRFPPTGYVEPKVWTDMALLGWRDRETREGLRRDVEAGKTVTIVGSSWEALELACWLKEGARGSSGETVSGW